MKTVVSATISLAAVCGIAGSAIAQVVPDNTVGTQVTQAGAVFNINNGMRSGNNLFHSFSQFSVPTGGSAIFNNATNVQNIFSRITGSQLSNIDGILRTQGTANLFLMNPNGIVFGPNAQLQLGGSFLGTTATGIKFADGVEFSAVNSTPALLSVNVPIGLQMGSNSASITVRGASYGLIRNPATFAYTVSSPSRLSVGSARNLALVGREINLEGGRVSTRGGKIELSSINEGLVRFDFPKWQWDYSAVSGYADIRLSRALIDAISPGGGAIHLQGRDITLQAGSQVIIQNQSTQPAGGITINAARTFTSKGKDPITRADSTVIIENLRGIAGDIIVTGQQVLLQGGKGLQSLGLLADTSNIQVTATDSISLIADVADATNINSLGYANSNSGDITLTTNQLIVRDGSNVAANSFGQGQGGNVLINARNVEVRGSGRNGGLGLGSYIGSGGVEQGNSGNVTINSEAVAVLGGARIDSSSASGGNAGNVVVNASKSVEVSGSGNPKLRSAIISAADSLNGNYRPTGNSGNVTIITPTLTVSNGGEVGVRNDGPGKGGTLDVQVSNIFLNQGRIIASTQSGNGGNINLNLKEGLFSRNRSLISSNSGGSGSGGNISIDSPLIVGLENSDIIANAVKGRGGNINITTQGLFGLEFRSKLTPENDITASSEFGINGNVQVNTIGINPANALNELPMDIVDSSRQIADRCGAAKTGSFIATGRGGMPQGPIKKKGSDRPWNDFRPTIATNTVVAQPVVTFQPLVEASAFERDETGTIALVAAKPVGVQAVATCAMGMQ